ncbi:MAG TPA: transcriptional regulator [Stenomitos sp.]
MKEVKTQRSRSYREYLLASLKDSQEAAAYIETFLELDEEGFEPELLRSALKDVVDARIQINNLSDEAKQRYEKLDKMLLETKAAEIYSLIEFLDALGFCLAIAPKD